MPRPSRERTSTYAGRWRWRSRWDRPFAKSTLQLFRARLILHDRAREVFERSLRFARETGYLRGRRMKVALDTTYILGRGAVKDTYNLLADGIVKLMGALSELEGSDPAEWATANEYQRYIGSSVKGAACIDWDDRSARAALLGEIVGDADRLLELSRRAQGLLDEDSSERRAIAEASELLGQLLLQDVERTDDVVSLKRGVSRDRMVSVHDPRHATRTQEQQQAVRWTQGVGGGGYRLAVDHRRGRAGGQRI